MASPIYVVGLLNALCRSLAFPLSVGDIVLSGAPRRLFAPATTGIAIGDIGGCSVRFAPNKGSGHYANFNEKTIADLVELLEKRRTEARSRGHYINRLHLIRTGIRLCDPGWDPKRRKLAPRQPGGGPGRLTPTAAR